jgi:transcriptional regulator with XRE-family HTH domain
MTTEIEDRCAHLLRELRKKKGMTLHEFEAHSNGAIKAVVLGSYERGTRAVSLARLEQLAELYGVSVEYFFTHKPVASDSRTGKLVCDLRRIKIIENLTPELTIVKQFLSVIAQRRDDWNGEVLSLRASDGEVLSMLNNLSRDELFAQLHLAGFLFGAEVTGQHSL